MGRALATAPVVERSDARHGEPVVAGGDRALHRRDVDGEHLAGRVAPAHLVHGHVVEEPTVDQQVAVVGNGGQHTRDGDAGSQGVDQRSAIVHHERRAGEVGGDAEVRHPEVGDVDVAEHRSQAAGDPPAAQERGRGQGGVEQAPEAGERPLPRGRGIPTHGRAHAHHCTDAGSADHVDRLAQVFQHVEHADVREPSCAAAPEHEGGSRAGQQPAEASQVAVDPSTEVVVRRQRTRLQPAKGAGRQRRVRVVEQHQADVLATRQRLPEGSFVRAHVRLGCGAGDEHDVIRPTDGPVAPLRPGSIRDVEEVLVAGLHLLEVVADPHGAHGSVLHLGDAGPGQVRVDGRAVDHARRPTERDGQLRSERRCVNGVRDRNDRERPPSGGPGSLLRGLARALEGHLGDLDPHLRVLAHEVLVGGTAEPDQVRVSQRVHRRGPWLTVDE